MAAGWYPGRCKDCAQDATEGASRCESCRKARNQAAAADRAERRRKHRCWACSAKVVPGMSSCEAHRGTAWRTG